MKILNITDPSEAQEFMKALENEENATSWINTKGDLGYWLNHDGFSRCLLGHSQRRLKELRQKYTHDVECHFCDKAAVTTFQSSVVYWEKPKPVCQECFDYQDHYDEIEYEQKLDCPWCGWSDGPCTC
jgi:hypothetical protein